MKTIALIFCWSAVVIEMVEPGRRTIDVDELTFVAEDIMRLCGGEVLALRMRNFVPSAVIERAREHLFQHPDRGSLGHAAEFTRLGIAFSEVRSEKLRNAYHRDALINIRRIRRLFGELASPIDRFRVMLDDAWPAGAHLLSIDDRKCFVGVCRYQEPGVDLAPHIDDLHWTMPEQVAWRLEYQLSANMYLQVPSTGGELEIWRIKPDSHRYAALQGGRSYGVRRDQVPFPDLVIKPEVGDLVIINPRFIHAVRPATEVDRITLSAFIGVKSWSEPLIFWS